MMGMQIKPAIPAVLIFMASATAAVSAERAESLRFPRDSKTVQTVKPLRAHAANPCTEFGPGFARIDGTSTCVKVGGSIGVEVGSRVGTGR